MIKIESSLNEENLKKIEDYNKKIREISELKAEIFSEQIKNSGLKPNKLVYLYYIEKRYNMGCVVGETEKVMLAYTGGVKVNTFENGVGVSEFHYATKNGPSYKCIPYNIAYGVIGFDYADTTYEEAKKIIDKINRENKKVQK